MKKQSTKNEIARKMTQKKLQNMIKTHETSTKRHFNPAYVNRKERLEVLHTWIRPICDSLELTPRTFHLTVSIIDFVTSLFYFEPEEFRNISLVSLCLASKIYENRNKMIYYRTFTDHFSENEIDYHKIEKSVLICLGFNLNIWTPHDFLVQFLMDPRIYFEIQEHRRQDFKSSIFELAMECSLQYRLNKFNSIGVAVSVLMATRSQFCCKKLFPHFLEKLTKLKLRALLPCFKVVVTISKKIKKMRN